LSLNGAMFVGLFQRCVCASLPVSHTADEKVSIE